MTDVFDDANDAVPIRSSAPAVPVSFCRASKHTRTPLGGGLSVDTSFAGSFDGSYLDLAHGSETIIQLGLAHAAAALLPTLKQRRFLLAEVGQFGFISRGRRRRRNLLSSVYPRWRSAVALDLWPRRALDYRERPFVRRRGYFRLRSTASRWGQGCLCSCRRRGLPSIVMSGSLSMRIVTAPAATVSRARPPEPPGEGTARDRAKGA